jgi:hypothetical protein
MYWKMQNDVQIHKAAGGRGQCRHHLRYSRERTVSPASDIGKVKYADNEVALGCSVELLRYFPEQEITSMREITRTSSTFFLPSHQLLERAQPDSSM